jgi:alpha-glucosidase
MKHLAIILTALLMIVTVCSKAAVRDSAEVSSPDNKLHFKLEIKDAGGLIAGLIYQVVYKNKPVILPSALGLKANVHALSNTNWYDSLSIVGVNTNSSNTTWKPVWGERANIEDHYNELVVTLKSTSVQPIKKGTMQLIVRAYNEGVAFRYYFPEQLATQVLEIGSELTTFTLPENTQAYCTDHAQGKYEKLPLKNWKYETELPLTLTLPGGTWACIAQAAQNNYSRMRLTTAGENKLVACLYGEVVEASPFATPWRVVMVTDRPGGLAEHNFIIQNLSPPSQITDVSWIKPGKVMREVTLSTAGAKKVIDFAVDQHIDYILFDAGWYGPEYEVASSALRVSVDPVRNKVNDLDMPGIISYARSKNKGIMLYVNRRAAERQLDSILPLYRQWGVAGVKFGFVQTGSQGASQWIYQAVKKAGENHLMVDVHDEYRPTGLSRTFPNLLTQEGIRGNEEFPDATHNTILAFTRMIAGAADYTPCFNDNRLKNTKGHQLALPVVLFSPWQTLYWYDKPDSYTDRAPVEFWKDVPTTWDESKIIDGTPGEFVITARRKQNEWYVGVITNNKARKINLKTDFLQPQKNYTAIIYEDNATGRVTKRLVNINNTSTLNLTLLAKGGAAIRIVPVL